MKIKDKYEFFNFNDTLNGIMTLFVLLLNNNWIYVSEMLYYSNNSVVSEIFLISFGIGVRFVCMSLILGLIAKVIVLFFEQEFEL